MNEKNPCKFCGTLTGGQWHICKECKEFSYRLKDYSREYLLERAFAMTSYLKDNAERIEAFKDIFNKRTKVPQKPADKLYES